ncbi:MAG: hypothetical protein R2697_16025 [Ilumatobacteraceae bacterium]
MVDGDGGTDAAIDRAGLLLVEGEPGIGKLTLCETLPSYAEGEGRWTPVVGRWSSRASRRRCGR